MGLGTTAPSRFVVIGNPIAHSMSPWIHNHFAQQAHLNIQYERLLSPTGGFEQTVRALQAGGVLGANVTVPFKQQAFALANELSESARFAQAANTLRFLPNQRVEADNTDGAGLCQDLNRLLAEHGLKLSQTHVLMIGAGGAASGCVAAFKQAGVQCLTILNRTATNAQNLADRAQGIGLCASSGSITLPYEIPPQGYLPVVVVNASSSSLQGDVPNIDTSWLSHTVLAYDMMYAAQPTPFMLAMAQRSGKANLVTSDGLGMLVNQAAFAFEWWTGFKPDAAITLVLLKTHLWAKANG